MLLNLMNNAFYSVNEKQKHTSPGLPAAPSLKLQRSKAGLPAEGMAGRREISEINNRAIKKRPA